MDSKQLFLCFLSKLYQSNRLSCNNFSIKTEYWDENKKKAIIITQWIIDYLHNKIKTNSSDSYSTNISYISLCISLCFFGFTTQLNSLYSSFFFCPCCTIHCIEFVGEISLYCSRSMSLILSWNKFMFNLRNNCICFD